MRGAKKTKRCWQREKRLQNKNEWKTQLKLWYIYLEAESLYILLNNEILIKKDDANRFLFGHLNEPKGL